MEEIGTTNPEYQPLLISCSQTQVVSFLGVDLQPCKTITDTLAPVECINWVLLAWNSILYKNNALFGLVVWSEPSVSNL